MITKEKAQGITTDAIYDFVRKMKAVGPEALIILGTFSIHDGLDVERCDVNAVTGDAGKMLDCLVSGAQQIANEIGARKGIHAKHMFYLGLVQRLDMIIRTEDDGD